MEYYLDNIIWCMKRTPNYTPRKIKAYQEIRQKSLYFTRWYRQLLPAICHYTTIQNSSIKLLVLLRSMLTAESLEELFHWNVEQNRSLNKNRGMLESRSPKSLEFIPTTNSRYFFFTSLTVTNHRNSLLVSLRLLAPTLFLQQLSHANFHFSRSFVLHLLK